MSRRSLEQTLGADRSVSESRAGQRCVNRPFRVKGAPKQGDCFDPEAEPRMTRIGCRFDNPTPISSADPVAKPSKGDVWIESAPISPKPQIGQLGLDVLSQITQAVGVAIDSDPQYPSRRCIGKRAHFTEGQVERV